MGDSIMGLGSVQYFRSLFPECKIYYGVPAWVAPLYQNVETQADEIIPICLANLMDFFRLWKTIKDREITHVHEMHLSGRTKLFFGFYKMFNSIQYTYHNHHLKTGGPVVDQGVIKSLIQRDLDGIYSFYAKDKKLRPNAYHFPPSIALEKESKKKIIFGMVATRETKKWPVEYYRDLATYIEKKFPEYLITIPLSQSEDDRKTEEKIGALFFPNNCQIAHIPLSNLASFISEAVLYIGNDTGLKHLAVACGVKSFTFFGPESPVEWHPYDQENHHYFFREGLECRTRSAHYCALSTCESMICLNQIEVSAVAARIGKELEEGLRNE